MDVIIGKKKIKTKGSVEVLYLDGRTIIYNPQTTELIYINAKEVLHIVFNKERR
ncbi:hypothetical protein [Senegalia massiliensis]|uniref:hypothetical protein n=1 Tax=Senegalia massiliensis TaxID=1720316 RepID=UPI0013EF21DA|nr:hypothetical protein [Senegalia massiliensis]